MRRGETKTKMDPGRNNFSMIHEWKFLQKDQNKEDNKEDNIENIVKVRVTVQFTSCI